MGVSILPAETEASTEQWNQVFFLYKNNFIRTSRLKFRVKFFQELEIDHEILNESLDQEKHFKHIFEVGVG